MEQAPTYKGVALYYRITEVLRDQIKSGRLRPGDLLSSEDALCESFHVSRTTLRAALSILASEGLIYRKQGRGTYVAEPQFEQFLPQLLSFSEEMKQKGLHPGAQVLKVKNIPADEQLAKKLRIQCGEPVTMIKRLRFADSEPIGIQTGIMKFSNYTEVN
ncbi:MAG: GntR family transcriptional regulator [Candidatus Hadarchaeum sp.]|uniref:GntR family transcriptional regulator n=1 Tax=Candidatus Hadarchaeum sp. TaxID=2883567 RepID=UPI00317D9F7D